MRSFRLALILIVLAICNGIDASAFVHENPLHKNGYIRELISEDGTWEERATIYREVSRFDEQGRTVESEIAFLRVIDGTLQIMERSIGKYFYDSQGIHTKTVFTWPDGSVHLILTFAYDDRGNQIDQTSTDQDGMVKLRFEYAYDADGNRTEVKGLKGDGQLVKRFLHEYDADHRVRKTVGFNGDGSIEYQAMHRYDNDALSEEVLIYKEDGKLEDRFINYYLKSKLITSELRYKADGHLYSKVNHSYEYDEKGNWTVRTSTEDAIETSSVSSPHRVIRRTIKYY